MLRALVHLVTALVIILVIFLVPSTTITESPLSAPSPNVSTTSPLLVQKAVVEATSTSATSTAKKLPTKKKLDGVPPPKSNREATTTSPIPQEEHIKNQVSRTENPYSSPPLSTDTLDTLARSAIVNIFCQTKGTPLSSASGSGVIIDPKGVILTNAHVAQYLLISTDSRVNLECSIRTGSPAISRWRAAVLYFPQEWVSEHADEITQSKQRGTGESDYALLYITESTSGEVRPPSFPYLRPDTREAIAFASDSVLLAGYPSEFTGGSVTYSALYPSSVFTQIGTLLTFNEDTVDLISLGNIVLAQSGSSGGAVVNMWGFLVGLISTTSEGSTTGDRDLRAITLAYINRDIRASKQTTLEELLSGNVSDKAKEFMHNTAPTLAQKIIDYLPH